ncbi:hypothetical protein [Ottowia sp. oral taxon 894]|uniref:hypothetical protein n=1 Tax=Ottowia sp. oral taxon 894 TaxID=1658672 RepID=UPI0012E246AC|nr:hypothetical protein [Ottowia sp. oral taxon 894]
MTEAQMVAALRAKGYLIREPELIQIGDVRVPKPLMEPPPLGTRYWFLDIHRKGLADHSQWSGGDLDNRNLKRGLVHLIERAALEHAKALIKVSGGTWE